MSPILLRPIRGQFEHDRVIRQLQTRWHRRFEAAINVGNEEEASVKVGSRTFYPDLVLTSTTSGRRLHGVVEVETAESVNHLEAMAEWKHFAKVRGAFYLYVPAGFTDVAERLCEAAHINVTEVWAYYAIGSQVKFSMSYRSPRAKVAARAAARKAKAKESRPKAKSATASDKTVKRPTSAAGKAKAAKKPKTTSQKKVAAKPRSAKQPTRTAKKQPLKKKKTAKTQTKKKAKTKTKASKKTVKKPPTKAAKKAVKKTGKKTAGSRKAAKATSRT